MFINFSNHPSNKWDANQLCEAKKYGEIIDIPFPQVDPVLNDNGIADLCIEYVNKILELKPDVVMCQGEFTLSYYVINELKAFGIKCVAACSQRKVSEEKNGNEVIKVSKYEFVQFREYCWGA